MAETVEALSDAFLEHYTQIGKPLSIPTQSMDQIMCGYFRVNDLDKTISCKLDTRDQKAEIDFSYAENVVVQNRFEMDSRVIVTMNRRDTMYDSLMDDFEGAGVQFPDEHWKGSYTDRALPAPPAKKAKTGGEGGGGSSTSSPAKAGVADTAVLSSALRKRLAAATTGVKEEP